MTMSGKGVREALGEPAFEPLESRLLLSVSPPAPLLVDLQSGSDSGISPSDNLTNIRTGVIDITAARTGDSIRVYGGGNLLGGAINVSGTLYRYTFASDQLVEGPNTIAARSWDGVTESGDSPALVITLDTTPPYVSSHTPESATYSPVSQFGITFNEPINASTFTVSDVTVVGPAAQAGILSVGHTGRVDYAVAVDGSTMCEATSEGLAIWNVSSPANPVLLGQWANPNPAVEFKEVAVSGSKAFIAAGTAGLYIVDISNPAAPALLGTYDADGSAYEVEVSGTLAYVADADKGLKIIDFTDPLNPTLKGALDTTGTAYEVSLTQWTSGPTTWKVACVADGTKGLKIIDVSNPISPALLGTYIGSLNDIEAVQAVGSKAYIVGLKYNEPYHFYVVEMSTPSAPTAAGSTDMPAGGSSIDVAGSYAVVADGHGMQVFNISSPAAPFFAGSLPTSGTASDVEAVGSLVYEADGQSGRTNIIDLSTMVSPTLVGHFESYETRVHSDITYDIEVVGDYAYVANGPSGLLVLNVHNPALPTFVGSLATQGNANRVTVVGSRVYVAEDSVILGWRGGIEIFDISTPGSPMLLGSWQNTTSNSAEDVDVVGTYAYLADGSGGLQVIHISNAATPVLAGSFATAGYAYAVDVDELNLRAFVAEGSLFQIINVAAPASPTLIGSYVTWSGIKDIVVNGSMAYVAKNGEGLKVFDVSNPASPTLVGWGYTPFLLASNVEIDGSRAYVANYLSGVCIFDISTPSSPTLVGCFDTPRFAYDVDVVASIAYVADGDGGVRLYDLSTMSPPVLDGSTPTVGVARVLAVAGDRAYVGDYGKLLRIHDISTPASPVLLGSVALPDNITAIKVVGSTAYVATTNIGTDLIMVDVSNPASPGIIHTFGVHDSINAVDVAGDLAYLVDSSGLTIVNVSTPTSPALVGSLSLGTGSNDIVVVGTKAYVAGNSFTIVNVTTPSTPTLLGSLGVGGSALQVVGNLAYVAGNSLTILDVTTPGNIVSLGSVALPSAATDISVIGSVAFLADYSALVPVDVTNPAAPTLMGTYTSPRSPGGSLEIVGATAYEADTLLGMQVFDISRIPIGVAAAGGNSFTVSLIQALPAPPSKQFYKVTIGPNIADLAGNLLDGDGNGTAGDPYVFTMPHQSCDINLDGKVNIFDAFLFNKAWGSKIGEANYSLFADFNRDGKINIFDAFLLNQNWGRVLADVAPVGSSVLTQADAYASGGTHVETGAGEKATPPAGTSIVQHPPAAVLPGAAATGQTGDAAAVAPAADVKLNGKTDTPLGDVAASPLSLPLASLPVVTQPTEPVLVQEFATAGVQDFLRAAADARVCVNSGLPVAYDADPTPMTQRTTDSPVTEPALPEAAPPPAPSTEIPAPAADERPSTTFVFSGTISRPGPKWATRSDDGLEDVLALLQLKP